MNDLADVLRKSVGAKASNNNGEYLGSITGIIHDTAGEEVEYIVLESGIGFGRVTRDFAIPARSSVVHIEQEGQVTIHLNKDDLKFARGFSANNWPKPNSNHKLSVFEIYSYHKSK